LKIEQRAAVFCFLLGGLPGGLVLAVFVAGGGGAGGNVSRQR